MGSRDGRASATPRTRRLRPRGRGAVPSPNVRSDRGDGSWAHPTAGPRRHRGLDGCAHVGGAVPPPNVRSGYGDRIMGPCDRRASATPRAQRLRPRLDEVAGPCITAVVAPEEGSRGADGSVLARRSARATRPPTLTKIGATNKGGAGSTGVRNERTVEDARAPGRRMEEVAGLLEHAVTEDRPRNETLNCAWNA
jgi:hypothetical protein